jgi:hypothetical protein
MSAKTGYNPVIPMERFLLRWCLVFGLTFYGLAGCGLAETLPQSDLLIHAGWARTLVAGGVHDGEYGWKTPVGPWKLGPNGLVFLTIENRGEGGDRLVGVRCDLAEKAAFQRMMPAAKRVNTRDVGMIEIPAGSTVELKPGSYFIRLTGLRRKLTGGEKFELTLEFEHSGVQTVEIVVVNP